ncbi:hypothetical protein ACS0TY_023561 [Phlomoides rotata]
MKKMEVSQHIKYFCKFYGKYAVKRKVIGIWGCKDCGKVKAGGAYTLNTASFVTVRSTIRSFVTVGKLELVTSLKLKMLTLLTTSKPECDAMRIKPIVIEHSGRVYWKLNCCKDDVVHQNVGRGDTLALDEKWFILDNEGK